jgi:CIC family chloride channel protein
LTDHTGKDGEARRTKLIQLAAGMLVGLGFGLVMSLVSNGFVAGVVWLTSLRETQLAAWLGLEPVLAAMMPLICLLVAAFLILQVRRLFGITRWHGPADSIFAAHRTDNELDIRSGFGSTIAALISAGGGASVGQYGPLVHFGATMGSAFRALTGGMLTTDVFIGCGVAGAIAAGFNAPIAGVVFAHEAILRHFSMRAIAPIAVASISSSWFSQQIFGAAPLLDFASMALDLGIVLPAALVLGPVFGLVAVVFMVCVRSSLRFAATSGWSPARLVFLAAGITGLVGIFVPEVLGLGTGPLRIILDGGYAETYLLVLLAGKMILTALCIGFGLFGGVFSPALFVGAAAGAIGGRIAAGILGVSAAPALAICGMAAVASAVIGAPVAGVMIILEMTMNYQLALAAMLSVVTCCMVSNLLFGHSFFDRQLLDRGIDVSQGRGHIEMMETPVLGIVSDDFVRIDSMETPKAAMKSLVVANLSEGYLISDRQELVGKVTLQRLVSLRNGATLKGAADRTPLSIKHDASLQQAIEVASGFVGESIPVVDRETGRLHGVVTEADLFQLYLSLQTRIADLERA